MATAASVILDRAETILQDTSNARWSEAELLDWLNEGQKQIVLYKPDANASLETMQLSSGTEQDVPTDAHMLLDATYNMGDDGTTVGDAITIVDRGMMDACYPGWQNETAASAVTHVIYDPVKLPKKFWVYPASDGANYIQLIVSDLPSDVAAKGNNISLADEYVPVLLDWMLMRAFQKDAEYNENMDRVLQHYDSFQVALGIRERGEDSFAPRRSKGGLA